MIAATTGVIGRPPFPLDSPSRRGDDCSHGFALPGRPQRWGDDWSHVLRFPWTSPAAGAMIVVTASPRVIVPSRGGDDCWRRVARLDDPAVAAMIVREV
jgi:hypothetical protein